MSRFNSKKTYNPIINIFLNAILGNFIFILLISFSSLIILNFKINSSYLYLFVILSSSIGILFASFITSRKAENKKLFFGIATALILTIIHFLLILCFNNSDLAIKTYTIFPLNILSGTSGSLIGINVLRK